MKLSGSLLYVISGLEFVLKDNVLINCALRKTGRKQNS